MGHMFGTILISVCTVMHVYVFWRATSVPFIERHVPRKVLIGTAVILWAVFFFGRVMGHGGTGEATWACSRRQVLHCFATGGLK